MYWMAGHCPDRVSWIRQATATGQTPDPDRMTREECWQQVRQVLADVLDLDPEKVTPEAHLIEDLGMG